MRGALLMIKTNIQKFMLFILLNALITPAYLICLASIWLFDIGIITLITALAFITFCVFSWAGVMFYAYKVYKWGV